MATIGNLWINVKSNTKGLSKGLSKSKGMLGKFGKFAASPAGIATAAFAALTAGIFAAGKAVKFAIGEFMRFEAAMAEVRSILLDVSNSDFARLEDSAKKLGATTSFTAEQSAKGMANLARAGFNTNEILSATPAVLDLAAATGMELAEAADIAAVAVRGFGLDASETAHVADVLALAASRTNTTVQEMGDAFSYVAPVANQLGFSIEETAAMIGKLADSGIKGSKAGTALRTMFLKLGGDIEKHGTKAFFDYLKAQHGVVENMEKFGKIGVTAAGVLSQVTDETKELKTAMEQANDVVGEMAKIRLDTLEGDTQLLKSAISGLAIAVGDELAPALRTGTQAATGFFAGLTAGFNSLSVEVEESSSSLNLWHGLLMVVGMAIIVLTAVLKFLLNVIEVVFWTIVMVVSGALSAVMKLLEWATIGVQKFLGLFMDTSDWDTQNVFSDMADELAKDAHNAMVEMEANAKEGVHAITGGLVDGIKDQYDAAFGGGVQLGEKTTEGVVAGIEEGAGDVAVAIETLTEEQMTLIEEGTKLTTTLQDQIEYFGMTAAEILIAKAATEDLNSATIEGTLALEQQLQALKDKAKADEEAIQTAERLADEAAKVIESIRTEQEVYDDEVSKLQNMMDLKLLTLEQFNKAVDKLKSGTEEEIEVNIVTKGIVEGLQSAMGTIKVAGQVNKAEQLAEKALEIEKNIEKVMTAVKENTADVKKETETVANNTQNVADKLAGTLTTDVTGLETMMGTVVTSINNISNNGQMDETEQLLETSNDLSSTQLTELQNVNRNLIAMKSGGALT